MQKKQGDHTRAQIPPQRQQTKRVEAMGGKEAGDK
jgi:hypothetical protein